MSGTYRIAIVQWTEGDGVAQALHDELLDMGHTPSLFHCDTEVPALADIVFSFAPWGRFMPVVSQMAQIPVERRPVFVHWNTDGLPDLRIPWGLISRIGAFRSRLGRYVDIAGTQSPSGIGKYLAALDQAKMLRYRYIGDYYYAYKQGWLTIFADSSEIYGQMHRQHGLPTLYFPWGAVRRWYDDLYLERDIDVLWMGKRGSKRRSQILDRVREELRKHGVDVYMADNEERPFVFDDERTNFLNRAKITLNVTRTWYDDNFSRFSMAAPNRSLIVSEPVLPHCPEFRAGTHYVSAEIDELADSILYYLEAENERNRIVSNAYDLVTNELTMQRSLQRMLCAAEQILDKR